MDNYRLDLKTIEQSLREVQREFPKINEILQSRRDSMTDAVLENMLSGYIFVDQAVADGADLFTLRHATALLELNHIVLCGLNEQVRQEYQTHIEITTQRFYEQEEFNSTTSCAGIISMKKSLPGGVPPASMSAS